MKSNLVDLIILRGLHRRAMSRAIILLATVASVVSINGQVTTKSESKKVFLETREFERGFISEFEYVNESLGLKLRFPKELTVETPEDLAKGNAAAARFLEKQGASKESVRKQLETGAVLNLYASKPGVAKLASLSLSLGRASSNSIADLESSVDSTMQIYLRPTTVRLEVPKTKTKIGKVDFFAFSVSWDTKDGRIFQKLVAGQRNGYLMTFAITYRNEFDAKILADTLDGAKFK